MKTDPTSPIKSQLCDIRRSGSQLQSIMDGRNAAARSSIITGTLRRIGIVGNESSLSICLFDFSFRENIANEKEILCGEESIRYPCQRNFSNFQLYRNFLYHNFIIVFVDVYVSMLLWIYRRGDPPSVSMYATLRYRIELYRVFLSMLFSLIFLTRFKHEFKFFVKIEEFFFSLFRGQRSFSRKEIGKKIYRFKNFVRCKSFAGYEMLKYQQERDTRIYGENSRIRNILLN